MTTPYKVGYSETNDIYWIEDNNGETVCDLYHKINEVKFYRKSNAKNNAHLFAAAPEMLETLKAIKNGIIQSGGPVPFFLQDVITKAKAYPYEP